MDGPPGKDGKKGLPGEEFVFDFAQPKVCMKCPMGITGKQGDLGRQGPQGSDGQPGIPGTRGRNGLKGRKGTQGDTGPPGMSLILCIENNSILIDNSKWSLNVYFSMLSNKLQFFLSSIADQ